MATAAAATKMATVFVSYSHADKEIADAIAGGLERRGFGVWIDTKGLRIGDSLISRIATAIEEGDFLLALVSEASRSSNWCRKEIALAMTRGINNRHVIVLPLRIGDVEMPPELKDTLWLDLDPNAIDDALDRIAGDINKHLADRRGGAAPTAAAATDGPRPNLAAAGQRLREIAAPHLDSEARRRELAAVCHHTSRELAKRLAPLEEELQAQYPATEKSVFDKTADLYLAIPREMGRVGVIDSSSRATRLKGPGYGPINLLVGRYVAVTEDEQLYLRGCYYVGRTDVMGGRVGEWISEPLTGAATTDVGIELAAALAAEILERADYWFERFVEAVSGDEQPADA